MANYWREYAEGVKVSPFPKLTDNTPSSGRQKISLGTELSLEQGETGHSSVRRDIIKALWTLVLSKYTNSTSIGFVADFQDLGTARTSLIKAEAEPTLSVTDLLRYFQQDEIKSDPHCTDNPVELYRLTGPSEKLEPWNTLVVFEDGFFMDDDEDSSEEPGGQSWPADLVIQDPSPLGGGFIACVKTYT